MSEKWDNVGYVSSSKYRDAVVSHLHRDGPSLPSEIAEATGHALPHVSRALAELREHDVVELLVSEQRHRGRVYGLTDSGEAAAIQMYDSEQSVEWSVVAAEEFARLELYSFLRSELGGSLRAVAALDGDSAEVVLLDADGAGDLVAEQEVPALVRNLPTDGETRDVRYAISGFDAATVVYVGDGLQVGIEIDAARDVPVPSFVEECYRALG